MTETVTIFAPNVAPQAAAIVAVTLPLLLTRLEIVKPAGMFEATTDKPPAGVKSSETVARAAVVPALPCWRKMAAAGVIVGEPLMLSMKFALVVAPQLSVAVTVIVYEPEGVELVTETTPVCASTDKLPVKPAEAATVTPLIEPLSAGGAEGVTVAELPGIRLIEP